MRIDKYGRPIYNEDDICDLYLSHSHKVLKNVLVDEPIIIPDVLDIENTPDTRIWEDLSLTIREFDMRNQSHFFMPDEYKNLDIAQWILNLCVTEEELQRVGQELLLFQKHNMFDLLKYLKYLVDTMREHNIVWGVGRGSSVASYVLFLIGVHKVNSLLYDLDPHEFLK